MTLKQEYLEFIKDEPIPIFMQTMWLDSVCQEDGLQWDVILYKKGGHVWGSFVYCIKKEYGILRLIMPKLTQTLGPYIKYPEGQKYYKKLSWEKELMYYFIKNLPEFDALNMNFNRAIDNWLPFYWKGFKQSTRYTYIIENIEIDTLNTNLENDIRRRIKKSVEDNVVIEESENIELLYELAEKTFKRQGIKVPYSYSFLRNVYIHLKDNIVINLAHYEGKYIAGNLLVFDDTSVYYLIGGIDDKYKDIGAMDLLQYESILFALKSKKAFDFEGSMIESIEKYFRGFGSVQKPYFNISKINSKVLNFKHVVKELIRPGRR